MRYLFIDAHNVIFSCPDLKALLLRNQDAAREALAERVLPIHDAERFRVVLVLDSRQSAAAVMRTQGSSNLEYVYAPADLSADGAIEKMLARLQQPEQAIVVSHDRWVRESTLVQGAQAMRPAELFDWADRCQQRLQRSAHRERKSNDSKFKNGLNFDGWQS
tara:strand:+ start:352 stop:837 length:486 start_codon:yes stop_codon:yes gene_type:complete